MKPYVSHGLRYTTTRLGGLADLGTQQYADVDDKRLLRPVVINSRIVLTSLYLESQINIALRQSQLLLLLAWHIPPFRDLLTAGQVTSQTLAVTRRCYVSSFNQVAGPKSSGIKPS
jgi:hypothetical protein